MFVLDASFIISAFLPDEPFYVESKKLWSEIRNGNTLVFEPEIVLPEVAAAVVRKIDHAETTLVFCEELKKLSYFYFISIDSYLAKLAADCAAKLKLKGADAIYVALASDRNLTLITVDKEQYDRASNFIEVTYLGRK